MSEMASLLPSIEQNESLIHTVTITPLSLLLASMDPPPTANPDAELVTECFEEFPHLDSPARSRSPTAFPDRRSWWCVVNEPAINKDKDHFRDDKVANVCCEEDNISRSSGGWMPGLAGHGGEFIGQGQHGSAVGNMSKLGMLGRCTLPSLKELGLDVYIRKRRWN